MRPECPWSVLQERRECGIERLGSFEHRVVPVARDRRQCVVCEVPAIRDDVARMEIGVDAANRHAHEARGVAEVDPIERLNELRRRSRTSAGVPGANRKRGRIVASVFA